MLLPLKTLLLAATLLGTSHAIHAQSAAATYGAKCQMCHGATGLGDTPAGKAMGAHPFNSPDVVKSSDSDLLAIIKMGKGKMPAFAGKLSAPEMAALVAYIRKL